MSGYTVNDWDYDAISEGTEGSDDYEPDAYVNVYCRIPGCGWNTDAGWNDHDNGPEGTYAEHWRAQHAPETADGTR